MKNSDDSIEGRSTFWKKGDRNVPGRPVSSNPHNVLSRTESSFSPKKDSSKNKHKKNLSCSSFQDFQDSTKDAWDIGDDDFCMLSDLIHPKVAQSTAMKVLTNHSKGNFSSNRSVSDEQSINYAGSGAKASVKQKPAPEKEPSSTSDPLPSSALSHPSPSGPGIGIRMNRPNVSAYSLLPQSRSQSSGRNDQIEKFTQLLNSRNTDLDQLSKLSWMGIPYKLRPITWRLLSGYIPPNLGRREPCLETKRKEYANFLTQYYETRNEDVHQETYRQIHIDVPRMSPMVPLFQQQIVQKAFERILYIWAIRHPASGYVQGMNDLVTPFFVVFLQDFVSAELEVETFDVSKLSSEELQQVEADSYFCMANLLDGIQDNYTFAQPGIQKKVNLLKELIPRINGPLHKHLETHSVEYLQFSFRWMNNLLMRELPLRCTIRLWDTYLAEPNGFSTFHLYVCAAFLTHWSEDLLHERDFQGLMLKLQNLPTLHWGDKEIELITAEAYKLQFSFHDANHLQLKL